MFTLTLVSPQTDKNTENVDGLKSIDLLNEEAKLLEVQLQEMAAQLERLK